MGVMDETNQNYHQISVVLNHHKPMNCRTVSSNAIIYASLIRHYRPLVSSTFMVGGTKKVKERSDAVYQAYTCEPCTPGGENIVQE